MIPACGWCRDFYCFGFNIERYSEAFDFFASVKAGDSTSSKTAFIASAEALDKWTRLTGLSEKVVGL